MLGKPHTSSARRLCRSGPLSMLPLPSPAAASGVSADSQVRKHATVCLTPECTTYMCTHTGAKIDSHGLELRACLGRNLSPRKARCTAIRANSASAEQRRSMQPTLPEGRGTRLTCKTHRHWGEDRLTWPCTSYKSGKDFTNATFECGSTCSMPSISKAAQKRRVATPPHMQGVRDLHEHTHRGKRKIALT